MKGTLTHLCPEILAGLANVYRTFEINHLMKRSSIHKVHAFEGQLVVAFWTTFSREILVMLSKPNPVYNEDTFKIERLLRRYRYKYAKVKEKY